MNREDLPGRFLLPLVNILKPLVTAAVIVVLLQVTGLMSSVSYFGQWALLKTGLKDTTDESMKNPEDFDYQFTIKDLDENKMPFENLKGKVIFLNLWATWCGPCRAEMPTIQSLYEKVDKEKISFVMLSIDKDSDRPKVVNYLKAKGFTFQAFMPSGYLPNQLRVPVIPTTFIISRDGKIVKKEIGSTKYDTPKFQKYLEELTQ